MKKLRIIRSAILAMFLLLACGYTTIVNAEMDKTKSAKDNEFNVFMGKFDFSDDGKRSTMYGIQHQDEELFNETFLGKISPVTGAFITAAGASYIYTGIQAEYDLGPISFNPSFAPGYYTPGDGKDLGHALEFKTELQMTFDLFENSHFGMSYNHISNASLGKNNPGANSYMFNFLQKF